MRSGTATSLIESAVYYHTSGIWWLHLFLLMPDHLHALLAVPPGKQLGRTIAAWKSYQSKSLKVEWQAGFFDHRLRNDESLEEKAHYIRMNPVRAGLVAMPGDWPHVWDARSRR
jgi:REP element-mobilizing transposase RayT